ncbi:hypothetical protein HG535_0G03280 [Zygotorulaspora mrakii]|uniref:DNA-directed RNA polymerase III subunit RPC9 n=1 Tax=Zygotorulaspora mrakii TaxID=42260 RepID=A0A7H9B6U3_ZYGMR|nr:uncharacterized protein HG535_0G03280 [Zygotorulaspora mrakii]QLG74445.1 hypothetical protein HG535_0G03280 [Zygotorulaspora mrakii]
MKIIEARDAFFSDYETLQFLSKLERQHHWDQDSILQSQNQKKKLRVKRPYNNPVLQNITKNTIDYLSVHKGVIAQDDEQEQSEESSKNAKSALSRLNDAQFSDFVKRLNEFQLFKAEKLQIVNQLPSSMVHLYAVVEECDSRFSEQQVEQLLSIIADYL